MAAIWKLRHKGTSDGLDKDSPIRFESVLVGTVRGLTDAADQLSAALTTARAAYTVSGAVVHPDNGLPFKHGRARWESGDKGDGIGAIAVVEMFFGVGGNGGVTGGTINGWTIISGRYWVGTEEIIESKGPGFADIAVFYGVGRESGFEVLAKITPVAVPVIPVGGKVTATLAFDQAGSVTKTGDAVVARCETVGVGFVHITGKYRST